MQNTHVIDTLDYECIMSNVEDLSIVESFLKWSESKRESNESNGSSFKQFLKQCADTPAAINLGDLVHK